MVSSVDDELDAEPNPHCRTEAQQCRYIRNAATALDARQGGLGHPRALRYDLLRQASALTDLTQLVSELQVTARLLVFGVGLRIRFHCAQALRLVGLPTTVTHHALLSNTCVALGRALPHTAS